MFTDSKMTFSFFFFLFYFSSSSNRWSHNFLNKYPSKFQSSISIRRRKILAATRYLYLLQNISKWFSAQAFVYAYICVLSSGILIYKQFQNTETFKAIYGDKIHGAYLLFLRIRNTLIVMIINCKLTSWTKCFTPRILNF